MATTGTALYPGASTFPNTTVFPGQGTSYIVRCYLSTDDASVTLPTWTEVTLKMRAFSTARGRNSERDQFDAGTATVVLDNRDRSFDPVINSAIKPLNRIWLFEEFSGERQDIYKGYAETIQQNWDPSGIVDATATFTCADEFKVLSLINTPATDPPRNTYADLVAFDGPSGYWSFYSAATTGSPEFLGSPGPSLVSFQGGSTWATGQGAIIGENLANAGYAWIGDFGGGAIAYGQTAFNTGDPLDPAGISEMTIELWVNPDTSVPGSSNEFVVGSYDGTRRAFSLTWTGSAFSFVARNGAGGTATASGGTAQASQWHHLVGTVLGGTAYLFVNGVQVGSQAFTGPFSATPTLGGYVGNSSNKWQIDEMAYWRNGLTSARIGAHFTAGRQRGVPRNQGTGDRIDAVLDAVNSAAPRSLQTGSRNAEGEFYATQAPIDMIHHALDAENVDAGFFTARDGTLKYLADGHRSSSPYNTVQMTFDDDGTDSPYMDCTLDFSEAFLNNEIAVTGAGGTLSTSSDVTSISRYFKRSLSISSEFILASNASGIAAALLAKYKDPFTRIITIKPKMADAETMRLVFARDLMDRIEIFRTPPGGGARIDQISFIQKIEIAGTPGVPPDVTFGVSPL